MSRKSWCSSAIDASIHTPRDVLIISGRIQAQLGDLVGLGLGLGLGLGSAIDASSLRMSRCLSWMSASALRACACPGPCRMVCVKISGWLDGSPSSAASISSCVTVGLTILYCRSTRSRYLDLYRVCTSWYSAMRSTNLRVSVACMFVRMRASLAPGFFLANSLFAPSIAFSCDRTFLASAFVPPISCSSFAVAALPCSALMAPSASPW
mmetsp:Transcript_43700/g.140348  ORF Transcript_43700/g.140348 Transcript_43700/m.140348 type:complete len:209 (-) Transcript_43700:217-843(-)